MVVMPMGVAASSIDAYIAGFSTETQRTLSEMRAIIAAAASNATERISYSSARSI